MVMTSIYFGEITKHKIVKNIYFPTEISITEYFEK